MSKRVWVEFAPNGVVTDRYMQAIGTAFSELGMDARYSHDIVHEKSDRDDMFAVLDARTAFKLGARGRKRFVFWSQGVWPEESYQRNHSKVRLALCSRIEKAALKRCCRLFVVSHAMLEHYERKYGLDLAGKTYVMPCANEEFHPDSFEAPGKYEAPVFIYAGSLSKWQCIDQMLFAFRQALDVKPDARLLFYTSQQDEAKALVKDADLRNVTLGYAPKDELNAVLAKAKYGFVIRDDSVINRVATPTKISSYVSNGVIPVYSSSLAAFSESLPGIEALEYKPDSFEDDFAAFDSKPLSADRMLSEYKAYFDREFDYSKRSGEIAAFLSKAIGE